MREKSRFTSNFYSNAGYRNYSRSFRRTKLCAMVSGNYFGYGGILPIFTLRYALRATQDEIGREKRILSSGSRSEPRIEERFSRLHK